MEARSNGRHILIPLLMLFVVLGLIVAGLAVDHYRAMKAAEAERARLEEQRREELADAAYFTVAEGARAYGAAHAYGWCAAAAFPALGPFALVAGAVCSAIAYKLTDGVTEAIHSDLFQRPYHEDAATVGRVVGVIGGALLAVPTGDYASYEETARSLSEKAYRANKALIDPKGLRGAAYHLHHRVPLRCGYMLLIPPAIMAQAGNLKVITAEANRRIGVMGCAG